jgi:hypothetical protein
MEDKNGAVRLRLQQGRRHWTEVVDEMEDEHPDDEAS